MLNVRTKALVKTLLENKPKCRDDDRLLLVTVWYHKLGKARISDMSASDFIKFYARSDHLPNAESVRRTRQKLQEQHPELRGSRYSERQESLEPAIRQQVRIFKDSEGE